MSVFNHTATCPLCVKKYLKENLNILDWGVVLINCTSCLGSNRAPIPMAEVFRNLRGLPLVR